MAFQVGAEDVAGEPGGELDEVGVLVGVPAGQQLGEALAAGGQELVQCLLAAQGEGWDVVVTGEGWGEQASLGQPVQLDRDAVGWDVHAPAELVGAGLGVFPQAVQQPTALRVQRLAGALGEALVHQLAAVAAGPGC